MKRDKSTNEDNADVNVLDENNRLEDLQLPHERATASRAFSRLKDAQPPLGHATRLKNDAQPPQRPLTIPAPGARPCPRRILAMLNHGLRDFERLDNVAPRCLVDREDGLVLCCDALRRLRLRVWRLVGVGGRGCL
jgi:hypothetical protein